MHRLYGRVNASTSIWFIFAALSIKRGKKGEKAQKQEKAHKVAGCAKMSAFALPQLPHDFFKRLIAHPPWL
ncbi:MAG: hypothetical protein WCP35_21265 [Verrucomicrobiota bacterium]